MRNVRWVVRCAFLVLGIAVVCPKLQGENATVIRAGKLFDGRSDQLLTNQVIVIQDDRIADVGPGTRVKVPAGAQEINLSGATVLPGLIDGHTHILKGRGPSDVGPGWSAQILLTDSWQYRTIIATVSAKQDLEAGFTAIRDCGSLGTMYSDTDLRRAINEAVVPGPRMEVATIPLTGTSWIPESGYSPEVTVPSIGRFVDSPWEGRQAVREDIKYGADLIKIFPGGARSHFELNGELVVPASMTREEMEAIVDEVHRQNKKAACHAFGGVALDDSIAAGCNSIELGADFTDDRAAQMARKGIFAVMGLAHTEYWKESELKATGGKYSRVALQKASLPRLMKAGVKIAFGTDAGAGPNHGVQAKEFKYLVEYGMTPAQALRSATSVGAELLGWKDRIGTIEKGKYADVIAVAGNPLEDITEMERVKFVMKGGQVVRNDLY